MAKTSLEKRKHGGLKERAQYGAAFGIIGLMLWVAGFPVFLLFFVGILSFFIWKVFSAEGRNETRRVFEFYLSANEILREDDRRWYGFEIQETVAMGETVVRSMAAAPPLVHFALGALYQKLGEHSTALSHLSRVVDDASPKETAIVYPTRELREYVRMLRKIERNPAEAPMTSSAIRSLERVRRTRGTKMLELSRSTLSRQPDMSIDARSAGERMHGAVPVRAAESTATPYAYENVADFSNGRGVTTTAPPSEIGGERKTISEVLHDIYDANVQ